MDRNYIKRSLETVLIKAASEFPAVVLTRPDTVGEDNPPKSALRPEVRLYFPGGSGCAGSHNGGSPKLPGYVVHLSEARLPLGSSVTALPFADL